MAALAKSTHQPRGYEATLLCLLQGNAWVRSDSRVETRLRLWNAYSLQLNGAVSMADSRPCDLRASGARGSRVCAAGWTCGC